MLTPKPKHPQLQFGRPIPTPGRFEPTEQWVDGRFRYRYDPKAGICKRSPVSSAARGGSQYFAVSPIDQTATVAATQQRLRQRRQKVLVEGGSLWRWRATAAGFGVVAVAALAVLVYPWLPEAGYRLRQATQSEAIAAAASTIPASADRPIDGNRLLIPKVGVDTPILESSSLDILDKQEGVWHQTGNQDGNFVLAGHRFRYLPPNSSTLYNLNKLEVGDLLAIDWLGQRTVYKVTDLSTVNANQVSILDPTTSPRLTIYTCTDIRQTQRTVVTAEPLPPA